MAAATKDTDSIIDHQLLADDGQSVAKVHLVTVPSELAESSLVVKKTKTVVDVDVDTKILSCADDDAISTFGSQVGKWTLKGGSGGREWSIETFEPMQRNTLEVLVSKIESAVPSTTPTHHH